MKNTIRAIISILIFFSTNVLSQSKLITGSYDIGNFVCTNKEIFGYIYDRIGDGNNAPVRSCTAYMTGSIDSKKMKIYFWDIKSSSEINKYEGFIHQILNKKGWFDLCFLKMSDYGLCSESTFRKDENGMFSNSIILEKEMPHWRKIVLIRNQKPQVFEKPDLKSKVILEVKYLDGIVVIDENQEFYKVEIDSIIGWLKKTDTFPLDGEIKDLKTLTISSPQSYFYTSTSDSTKRKAYLIKGDKATLLEEKNDWYYIEYKGKKTISGWIKKETATLQ